MAARLALGEWARATELSCDRAAALVMRDPMPVCRTLMRITAGAAAERLDLDAYLRQAAEYEEGGKGLDRLQRLWMDLGVTHAMPVRRVREVMDWVRTGEFERIVGGEYPRRGDPVDVRVHADDAVAFYTDRFQGVFRDAGDSLATATEQLGDWVRRSTGPKRGDEE
jgi:hypothetical protein